MIELLEKQMINGEEVSGGVKISLSALEENVLVAHGKAKFVEEEKQLTLPKEENTFKNKGGRN